MSNIIWKGINSNTIPGLIISKLPSISKPKLKTEIIDIDGVDGDIINELGYEAYDKEIEIGLSKDYQINDVIKYFTGEGELVFSNEPDKYYKAKIIDKIDYQDLLRFKTSTISFHVQPFKYKVNEIELDVSIDSQNSIEIYNSGLEKSKPIIHLYGTGTVALYLDNIQIFTYTFDDNGEVIIDSENQDAYFEGELKNRNMFGEFPILNVGKNLVTWTGNLERIKVKPKSRWL